MSTIFTSYFYFKVSCILLVVEANLALLRYACKDNPDTVIYGKKVSFDGSHDENSPKKVINFIPYSLAYTYVGRPLVHLPSVV